jgi:hypothetical protein
VKTNIVTHYIFFIVLSLHLINLLTLHQLLLTIKQHQMNILGIVTFFLIAGMAFWVLVFLLGFVLPFWITLGVFDKLRPKRVFEEEETE